MPNKMTTTKLSLAAAALLALAYPAWGAQPKKWECKHEDIEELHTIEVVYEELGQVLPAIVKYSKNDETRKLYYCTETVDYCEKKAKKLVADHEATGYYACEVIVDGS